MIMKEKNIGFQRYDMELAKRLEEVLVSKDTEILKCLPHVFSYFDGECARAKEFWKKFLNSNRRTIFKMFRTKEMKDYYFGDTQVTRPYIDYMDFQKAEEIYTELKKIWENRSIIIVEGFSTRMGIGNDLFNNAHSIKRIICPAENAFSCYQKILNSVMENCSDELVLIALGPTATVLAFDLARNGIWALDVGHLDLEYEWYKSGTKEKTAIIGKYVNEVSDGKVFEESLDIDYLEQIVVNVIE